MQIYHYNPDDREYVGQNIADPDPMVANNWLIPAHATNQPPPAVAERETIVFIDKTWQVVPDWRGHVYWTDDGQRHEITELGVEPPGGALDEAPPTPLADLATVVMARINAGYSVAMSQILAEYPDAETLSFDKQEAQAREWQAWQDAGAVPDDEPATPYLDAMLAERPIGKAELVERIIAKADQFTVAHGQATGRRQRLEDGVKEAQNAGDRASLEAFTW